MHNWILCTKKCIKFLYIGFFFDFLHLICHTINVKTMSYLPSKTERVSTLQVLTIIRCDAILARQLKIFLLIIE